MAGLILKSGSRVRVGFSVNTANFYTDYEGTIVPDLEGCLYNTGAFDFIEIIFQRSGAFSRDYLLIVAVTAVDFAQAEDFGGLVAEQVQLCAPDVIISSRDPVKVDAVPADLVGMLGVQQVNNQEGQGPTPRGNCANLSGLDYLGCQLGLSGSGARSALTIGGIALGAVLLIAVLKR